MSKFEPMVEHVKPGKQGVAEVKHVTVSEKDSHRTAFWSAAKGDRGIYVPPGDYVQLYVKGQLMMSDTRMEKVTNYEFLSAASGDVLIAGLGIGMVLRPLLQDPKVTSITVVEKYQDVIDLVKVDSPKLNIICADIFDWKPAKGTKYHTIYFDIWPDICLDNLEEMVTLHRRFARCKVSGGWMDSWTRKDLLARKRSGRGFSFSSRSGRTGSGVGLGVKPKSLSHSLPAHRTYV